MSLPCPLCSDNSCSERGGEGREGREGGEGGRGEGRGEGDVENISFEFL